ncbi:MAG: YidC/Oxa1 family membrane protein insertase [bacterium]|nr:YidC/Oxa1 family membrane protein insertase [bacterium]
MIFLYDAIIHQPLLNALVFFYNTVAFEDFGVAIIFLTILVRIVLFPIFHKSARHQTVMQRIQPKIQQVQKDHKDKAKQAEEMMKVYKEHNINPFSGFLFLLVQMPILIALYKIFIGVSDADFFDGLYSFVARPEFFQPLFADLINLSERSIVIVGLAALAQYFQGKLSLSAKSHDSAASQAEKIGRKMVYIGPILTIAIFYNFPAAVSLYWATSSVFGIFQQIIINKKLQHGELGTVNQKNS